MDEILTFDRTDDVSKLEGCNTRGVEYRWDIFTKRSILFRQEAMRLISAQGPYVKASIL